MNGQVIEAARRLAMGRTVRVQFLAAEIGEFSSHFYVLIGSWAQPPMKGVPRLSWGEIGRKVGLVISVGG